LQKAFLDYIARRYATAEEFAAWVSAGRPVRKAYNGDECASYPPIAKLLNLPETEAAAA